MSGLKMLPDRDADAQSYLSKHIPFEVNTFEDYLAAVRHIIRDHVNLIYGWRSGQLWFNVLWEVKPEIADQIRGTDTDPFYQSSKIGDFLVAVQEQMP